MSNLRTPAELKNCKFENPYPLFRPLAQYLESDKRRVLRPCVTYVSASSLGTHVKLMTGTLPNNNYLNCKEYRKYLLAPTLYLDYTLTSSSGSFNWPGSVSMALSGSILEASDASGWLGAATVRVVG